MARVVVIELDADNFPTGYTVQFCVQDSPGQMARRLETETYATSREAEKATVAWLRNGQRPTREIELKDLRPGEVAGVSNTRRASD